MASQQISQLQQHIEQCGSSSEIKLENQNLTDSDMEIVVRKAIIEKRCTELCLSSNKISSDSILTLVTALRNNKTLDTLWLADNHILDRGARILARFLAQDTTMIMHLSLASAGITDEGALHIANMLKKNNRLILLRLDSNDIGNEGVQAVADALVRRNPVLQEISLSNHKRIDDGCVASLTHLFENYGRLRYFTMENCSLSEKSKKKLRAINEWNYYFNKSL